MEVNNQLTLRRLLSSTDPELAHAVHYLPEGGVLTIREEDDTFCKFTISYASMKHGTKQNPNNDKQTLLYTVCESVNGCIMKKIKIVFFTKNHVKIWKQESLGGEEATKLRPMSLASFQCITVENNIKRYATLLYKGEATQKIWRDEPPQPNSITWN